MKFHHAMVRVSDLSAALDFYCGQLGLQEIRRFDVPRNRMSVSFVAAPGDIAAWPGEEPPAIELISDWDPPPPGGRDPFHICVAVEAPEGAWNELVRAGADPYRSPTVDRPGFVKAPEGTPVELVKRGGIPTPDSEQRPLRDTAGAPIVGASEMRLNHVLARTPDLEKSLAFYRDILGFVEVRRLELPDYRKTAMFLAPPVDAAAADKVPAASFELIRDWDDPPLRPNPGPSFHVCFWVPDIYGICTRLRDAGVHILKPPREGRVAFVRGPDGTAVELVQLGPSQPTAEPWASLDDAW